jgi:hypothetical protein
VGAAWGEKGGGAGTRTQGAQPVRADRESDRLIQRRRDTIPQDREADYRPQLKATASNVSGPHDLPRLRPHHLP